MAPVIPHRSLVGIEPCKTGDLVPGDVVAFDEGGRVVLSRLVDAGTGPTLRCRDDNARSPHLVPASALRGRAIWRSSQGSLLRLSGVKTGPGRFARQTSGRSPEEPATDAEIAWVLGSFRSVLGWTSAPNAEPPDRCGWYRCIDLALNHRIDGLLFPRWQALPAPAGPDAAGCVFLEAATRATQGRWQESLGTLRLVGEHLGRAGIPWVVLKGPVLAAECYADPGERPFTDLDVLVSPRDRGRALETLRRAGFTPKAGVAGKLFAAWGHFHLVLVPPSPRRLVLEMHWHLVDRANLFRIDVAEAITRARRVNLSGVEVAALDPIDEFLYLCVHLSRHGVMNRAALAAEAGAAWFVRAESGNRLIWVLDLVRHAARHRSALEPSSVRARAEAWNATAALQECLLLAEVIAGGAEALEPLLRGVARLPSAEASVRNGPPGCGVLPSPQPWAMRPLPGVVVRPVRLLELFRLFFPGPAAVRRYYRTRSAFGTAARCVLHPLSTAWRLVAGGRIWA